MKSYNKWTEDLKDTSLAIDKILPDINKFIAGDLYSVESSDNEILQMLDNFSGIDLIVLRDKALRGIASRIQWGNNWDTFTIRLKRYTGTKTEYQKRIESIERGEFFPALTLQAYMNNREDNKLLSMAVIKTIDLYELIETHNELFQKRTSDNEFLFIKWDDIKRLTDKKILIFRHKKHNGLRDKE